MVLYASSSIFLLMQRLPCLFFFFFLNDTATPEIYPLSLHDALPISVPRPPLRPPREADPRPFGVLSRKKKDKLTVRVPNPKGPVRERLKTPSHKVHRRLQPLPHRRSEEHTSELQSLAYLVCRLLLEK